MSKIRIRNKLFILCVFVLMSLCLMICVNVKADTETQDLLEEYNLYTELTIPEYVIEYGKESICATNYSLEFPNGMVKIGRDHVLAEPGKYTVHYSAVADGKYVSAERCFYVSNLMFSAQESETKTTAYYGKNEKYSDKKEGLVISLASGDALNFNKIINLNGITKNDNLLSFYITPITNGMYDATRLTFRFTDIYDENNWMQIIYKCVYNVRPWAKDTTYIVGQTSGNQSLGYTYFGSDLWGWPVYRSFCGSAGTYNLFYDDTDKSLWTDLVANVKQKGLPIADLDDDTIFTNPWEGFTTGEVKLSIFASSFNSPSMNIVLTNLAGYDLKETTFLDNQKPVISIDMAGNGDIPNGIINKKYKLFDATAMDDYSGEVDVKTNVYYRYNTPGQVNVFAENGYFTPKYAGVYTIEYLAEDLFGNTAVETKEVNVLPNAESLDFEVTGAISGCKAGVNTAIMNNLNVSNSKGPVNVKIVAALGNDITVIDENSLDKIAFDFLPMKAGSYAININVSDYVESVNKTFNVEVSPNVDPVFVDEVKIVDYFIKGQKYTLPQFGGYDLISGNPQFITAKAFISEDNGAEKEVGNNAFVVKANNNLKVIYRITNGSSSKEKIYDRTVVSATLTNGNLDVSKYYQVIDGVGNVSADDDGVYFSSNGNAKIKFINAVQVEDFITYFKYGEEGKRAFGGVNVYLTDSVDASIRVKVTYTWVDQVGYIAVNEGNAIRVPTDMTTSDRSRLPLGYKNELRQVYGRTSLMMNVPSTIYGEKFEGFPSKMAYIEYELFDVYGASEICILKINNQPMYEFNDVDTIKAEMFFKQANGDVAINDKVNIYGCRAYDVLSSYVNLSLKVTAPDGSIVTSIDGILLDGTCDPSRDYVINITQYGIYKVLFVAIDGSDNTYRQEFGFNCIDKVKPIITVDVSTTKANVGDKIKVRGYKVSDDCSPSEKLKMYIYVFSPDYSMTEVKDGTFIASIKGQYKIFYYCCDEAGNMNIAQYSVSVS